VPHTTLNFPFCGFFIAAGSNLAGGHKSSLCALMREKVLMNHTKTDTGGWAYYALTVPFFVATRTARINGIKGTLQINSPS